MSGEVAAVPSVSTFKKRQDDAKKKQSGEMAPDLDQDGKMINPHNPDFITKVPWYLGNSGDDSNPVPDATSARFLTPQLTANANYWVRASSAAGSVDSTTAVVTVLPPSLAEIEVRRDLGTGLEPVASGGLIDFGGSAVDVMAQPVAINVGNLGSENLTNLQVSIVGPDAADFGVDVTGFPTSIGSGLSEFFTVYMIPTSEGPKNAGLLIYSNDADDSPYVIGLVGNGSIPTPLAVTNPANGLTESAAEKASSTNRWTVCVWPVLMT